MTKNSMDIIYKNYLFQKHIVVSNGIPSEYPLETLFALASALNVRIVKGEELLFDDCVNYVAEQLGEDVAEPFYRGFPETPRQLPDYALLMDQLLHYSVTYGGGDFSEAGHSVFEDFAERKIFRETLPPLELTIVDKKEAIRILGELVNDLLASTRPLSAVQYHLVLRFINDYRPKITTIASKNTCVKLLIDTRDPSYAEHLALSDIIRLTEELNYARYLRNDVRRLNLRNSDRKLLSAVIDLLLASDSHNFSACYEKKKAWAGLLHHIHYVPKTDRGREFVSAMRGKKNRSVYAAFEKEMAAGNIREAVRVLRAGKGSGAVLRQANYIISRCVTPGDYEAVLDCMGTDNAVILIQLLMKYSLAEPSVARTFQFSKFNKLRVHKETSDEVTRRRSRISEGQAAMLEKRIRPLLEETLKGRLGKVFIDPDMERYALPLKEDVSQSGFGVLPTGSRLIISENTDDEDAQTAGGTDASAGRAGNDSGTDAAETENGIGKAAGQTGINGLFAESGRDRTLRERISAIFTKMDVRSARKKIRAFIYWEKVNDIDLSVIGINTDNSEEEFSWRTMYKNQSQELTFSGDQTSGYYGGSEYFDVDPVKMVKKHPKLRYLIFCANVYTSGPTFGDCFCRAGYMIRDVKDSGEVFEPKTVRSAFTVDAKSRFAYLFGIDLTRGELVWLNLARESRSSIAAEEESAFLWKYFHLTDIINVHDFFEMTATECVESIEEADVVVTDKTTEVPEGVEVIREYDIERMLALMNG